jgi:hypothetical protein
MKKLNQTIVILLVLIFGVLNLFAADNQITEKVNQYLNALTQQETTTLDTYINNEANFTMFNNIVNSQENHNKADYLKLVKDGQIGIWAKSTEVKDVKVNGDMAVVYLVSEIRNVTRQEYLTLINSKGNWEIVSSVSTLSKK